ncbi:MFS general substrate transporter [Dendrothele bispora CBS 962.96]|uniref:MFS general substrate transporter n=1 Tax=Dendrothele bispora (strain CBS 962.96) TaxID=1314807 RepID=A0A4S8M265_DENBC|nr:MFS general substrate transporter [Dendrothele bispora CBS 962.96]
MTTISRETPSILPELTRDASDASTIFQAKATSDDNDPIIITVHNAGTDQVHIVLDIEHMPVTDDPRRWSAFRKNFTLFQVSVGYLVAALAINVQTPAVNQMETDLPATSSQISMSISLFLLFQGIIPILWSTLSEVKGRKLVYITSLAIFTAGSVVVATSKSIKLIIGFRCFQAAGKTRTFKGAATLADIFDPEERGRKMGIYYTASLIGPSAGTFLGGVITSAFGWRGPFYFLTVFSGVILLSFILFFKDTFRRERSYSYQANKRLADHTDTKKLFTKDVKPADIEKQATITDVTRGIKVSLMDVNPIKPIATVVTRPHNLVILLASSLLSSFTFLVNYTTSRSLATFYHYNPLSIGLALLAFGTGNVLGSILGGHWIDYQLVRLTAKNGGKRYPEIRLKSILHGLVIFPLCIISYGWVIQERLHIAGVCAMLFSCGFLANFVYTSTIAYIIDSNPGRSSTVVALNSAFRGILAFILTEVSVPMQDRLGDGWMYTTLASLTIIGALLIALVIWKGGEWRAKYEQKDVGKQPEDMQKDTHKDGEK